MSTRKTSTSASDQISEIKKTHLIKHATEKYLNIAYSLSLYLNNGAMSYQTTTAYLVMSAHHVGSHPRCKEDARSTNSLLLRVPNTKLRTMGDRAFLARQRHVYGPASLTT